MTVWDGTRTCTRPDGSVDVHEGQLGGDWGLFVGAYDGDRFSGGAVADGPSAFEWSLTRLE